MRVWIKTISVGYIPLVLASCTTRNEAWYAPTSASQRKNMEQERGDGSI